VDDAWALLARRRRDARDAPLPDERLAALYDVAERIVANLETDCAARRRVAPEASAPEAA
jgi:hypothetical protein